MSVALQSHSPNPMRPFIAFSNSTNGANSAIVQSSDEEKVEIDENNNEISVKGQSWEEDSGILTTKINERNTDRKNENRARNRSVAISEFTDDEEYESLVIAEENGIGSKTTNDQRKVEDSKIEVKGRGSTSLHNGQGQEDQGSLVVLEGFSHYFPHNLLTLHKRQMFCDVTIRARDTLLHAHKVVLAACSPYFYNVLEKKQSIVREEDINSEPTPHSFIDLGTSVSPAGLRTVIDCMYSSSIVLHCHTVKETLEAATHLDMQLIVDACIKFIQNRRSVCNADSEQRDDDNYSPIDLTASSKYVKQTPVFGDENSAFQSDIEASDSDKGRETPSENNSTLDANRDIIYQSVSSQNKSDTGAASPKSINWKKDKYINRNVFERSAAKNISECDRMQGVDHFPGGTDEGDDDVFVKKEPSRSDRLSTDSGMQELTPPILASAQAANGELLRRDFYRQIISNSPYLLNPETMAAAVAMTTLTSPLRSPTNPQQSSTMQRPQHPSLILNPWQHILGRRLNQSLSSPSFPHSPYIDRLSRTPVSIHAEYIQAQKMRHQAMLNLSRYSSEQPRKSEFDHTDKAAANPYSPLLLGNFLHGTASQKDINRSYSAASTDGHPERTKLLTDEQSTLRDSLVTSRYLSSNIRDLSSHQQKKRRSANSSSGSPDRPYKCLVCAAEFNRPANLKTHMRIHSGEKPYKCQSCGARFVQVAHLRAHILIHTGEKPYPCKVCGTRFRHLQTLKSHLRIHTGEKPYTCDECQVRFRHKSQLRLHLRTKHGINTNTKKTYRQVPGLNNADINAHIKRTQEAVRMQAHRKEF